MSVLPLDSNEPVAISPVELELSDPLEFVSVSAAPLEVTLAVASVESEVLLVDAVDEVVLVVASDVDPPVLLPPSSPQAAENTRRKLRQAERDRDIGEVYAG